MEREQVIKVILENTETAIPVTAETEERLTVVSEMKYLPNEEYHGATEVTPTQETQTLYTANLLVPVDIIINPIPQNYGLVTWDGSILTVS